MATLKNTTINDTGYFILPAGTTAQRPGSPAAGCLRWNTTDSKLEVYDGSEWKSLALNATEINIITTGLELNYDIANTSCYPGTGTTVTDLTGNGHTGTLYGNTSYVSTYDGGFDFDGNGDYISISNSSTDSLYCLDIWWYNDDSISPDVVIDGPYQVLALCSSTYANGMIALGAWTGGNTNETINWFTSGGCTYIRDSVSVGIHNLVINWNGSTYDMWLDGTKKSTYANTNQGHATLMSLSGAMRLGGETGGYTYDYDGKIFNFRLYTSSLSDSDVTQNYNALKTRYGLS